MVGKKVWGMWIDVKDKLPTKGKLVLIAILHKPINASWYYVIRVSVHKNGQWLADLGHSYMNPTHWKLLPSPPPITKRD